MFKIEVNLKEMQVCLIWKKPKAYKFLCAEGVFLMRCVTSIVTFFGQIKWKYVLTFSSTIPGLVVGTLSVNETNCHLVFLLYIQDS